MFSWDCEHERYSLLHYITQIPRKFINQTMKVYGQQYIGLIILFKISIVCLKIKKTFTWSKNNDVSTKLFSNVIIIKYWKCDIFLFEIKICNGMAKVNVLDRLFTFMKRNLSSLNRPKSQCLFPAFFSSIFIQKEIQMFLLCIPMSYLTSHTTRCIAAPLGFYTQFPPLAFTFSFSKCTIHVTLCIFYYFLKARSCNTIIF